MKSRRLSSDSQLQDVESGPTLLRSGSTGTGVAAIQTVLFLLKFPMPRSIKKGVADGIFGSETDSVVKQFQQQVGLKADGIVGPRTLGAFDDIVIAKPFLDTEDPKAYAAAVASKASAPLLRRPVYYD